VNKICQTDKLWS